MSQIKKRQGFLEKMMLTKDAENKSYENSKICLITATLCVLVFCFFEIVSYFLYLNKFHPWAKIIAADDGKDFRVDKTVGHHVIMN